MERPRQTSKKRKGGLRTLARNAVLTVGLLGAVLGGADARTVKIISADTLELRQVDGQELVIISGGNVELRVDEDVVRARRVEYNRTRRTLTLVGAASYRSAKDGQDLSGENLVVELGDEQVTGQDVLISDADLEIRGQEVERIPGQLRATGGYFTTCAKCGRTPNDYAFRAERLIVYPGDRLVAYRAQLLLADVPVLFLPVIVIPLNDPERQPRLLISQDSVDGYTVEADLPFSVGSSTLGTTLLRYYQNRSPSVGLGVALRSYAPLPFVDRVNLYTLANPRPLNADGTTNPGYDIDINFGVTGRVPLSLAVRDLDYRLNVTRQDSNLHQTSPDRGVTRVDFGAKLEYPLFSSEFSYLGRFGPEPTEGIPSPYRKTEVVLDPKPYTNGTFSADTRLTAGKYSAQSNPLSPSATAQGKNISTTRLEEQHALAYTAQPWGGADLALGNTFTGRYYGTGARTMDLNVSAQLTQRFNTTNTVTFGVAYLRREGTSPFAFDALSGRILSAPLTLNLNTVPVKDVSFGISLRRDLFLAPDLQAPAVFTVAVNRLPLNLNAQLAYQPFTKELESFSYNATVGDPNSGTLTPVEAQPAREATEYGPAVPARPAYLRRSSAWPAPDLTLTASGSYTRLNGYSPFTLRATVTGATRADSVSAYVTHNIQLPQIDEVGASINASVARDAVLNPITFSASETLYPPTGRIAGNASVTWRARYRLSTAHDLLLRRPVDPDPAPGSSPSSGSVTFSVGTVGGSANDWQLTYGGPYDLLRGGFTRPTVSGTLSVTRPGQRLALAATVATPGLDQYRTELTRADLDANVQFGSRAALSGRVQYSRSRSGIYPDDMATDYLSVDPLRVSLGIGRKDQPPGAYLTASLRQTFIWVDGVRQDPKPLSPVLGLTIDRCCWAIQAEADLVQRRYRLSVGLPGQSQYPLFDLTPDGIKVPLLNPSTP
ncbi:LPS-assembly protein LptD [Deinococcus frigens]|uniref:LPS-assembly protein LptD n=1 Tax=Deinococcus frigens TaxID=249403 RepID=UPI00049707D1|nr:LPS-assembly protein LptD [Deinococcus frigens]